MHTLRILDHTLNELAYYFLLYSFIGWILETIYASTRKKEFINRGFLKGPFCPIYGFGTLSIILLLYPIRSNLLLLFIGTTLITSLMEYCTGFILETFFHSTWWDYSGEFCNLKGRICLRFSLLWGIVGIFVIKVVHPYIHSSFMAIPSTLQVVFFYAILSYFSMDCIYTLRCILQLKSLLQQLDELSTQMKTKVNRMKYEFLLEKKSLEHMRLLKAFPNLRFKNFDPILRKIRKKLSKRKNCR